MANRHGSSHYRLLRVSLNILIIACLVLSSLSLPALAPQRPGNRALAQEENTATLTPSPMDTATIPAAPIATETLTPTLTWKASWSTPAT